MRTLLSVALLGISCQTALAAWESSILPTGFQHENSLASASARAARDGKTAIVYYTRTQCPPCNALQSRLRKESVAAPFRDHYVFTAVWGSSMGSSERETYRSQYGVQGAPTWIFYRQDGQYLCTASGGFSSDEHGARLHAAVQQLQTSAGTPPVGPRECLSQ